MKTTKDLIQQYKEELKYIKTQILKETSWMINKMEDINNEVNSDNTSFNTYGELQGNALNLDKLTIEYATKLRFLKKLEEVSQ